MCYIIPKTTTADVTHTASSMDNELNVIVKIHDQVHDDDITSHAITLPFVPAFTLSTYEVLMNDKEEDKVVTVFGVPRQLEVLMVS